MNDHRLSDSLTELQFCSLVQKNAERTVVCSPELESRCKSYVQAAGLEHLITVQVERFCPDDRIYVMDHNAAKAAHEAAMAKALNQPIRLR